MWNVNTVVQAAAMITSAVAAPTAAPTAVDPATMNTTAPTAAIAWTTRKNCAMGAATYVKIALCQAVITAANASSVRAR